MVGPFGDWVKYDLEGPAVLLSECDGARLITRERNELLRRVPDVLADVFGIGSTAPGKPCHFMLIGPSFLNTFFD